MSTHWNQNSRLPLEPEGRRSQRKNPPLWTRKWVPFAALGVGMLLVGIGIGASGKDKPAEAVPAPTTTVTASASPAPTVTKSVEVPVTPKSCLEALNLSEQGFTLAAEAMGYMSDGMTAAGNLDIAGLQKANADLEKVNPKLSLLTQPMKQAAFDCRSGVR